MPHLKTAKELKIKDWEREGLLRVIRELRSGELKHTKEREIYTLRKKPRKTLHLFNMGQAFYPISYYTKDGAHPCGSIQCIGGDVAFHRGMTALECEQYVMSSQKNAYNSTPSGRRASRILYQLYYPNIVYHEWYKIKPPDAIKAITAFLRTGRVNWQEICPHLTPERGF